MHQTAAIGRNADFYPKTFSPAYGEMRFVSRLIGRGTPECEPGHGDGHEDSGVPLEPAVLFT